MELPTTESTTVTNQLSQPQPVKLNPNSAVKLYRSKKLLFIGIGGFLILFLLILLAFILQLNQTKNSPLPSTDSQNDVSKAKKESQLKTQSQAEKNLPANRIQQAYTDVVGSESYKRALTLDAASGVATIEYTIPSSDGTVIIKTSYENFADLAVKIFNIEGVKRLNVSTYSAKFTDQYGTPNQIALKMQLSKGTNDKIYWPLKKFSYKDYATILDVHEINSALNKDYTALVKASSN